mmetsp:Transcript_29549/g.94782  ORF Transcript_29549/g.94782 Transcript_29549/m.94782 type:complete len:92 (-) Transcript_29549:1557-1832(-)
MEIEADSGGLRDAQSGELWAFPVPKKPWSKLDSQLRGGFVFAIKERIQCTYEGAAGPLPMPPGTLPPTPGCKSCRGCHAPIPPWCGTGGAP